MPNALRQMQNGRQSALHLIWHSALESSTAQIGHYPRPSPSGSIFFAISHRPCHISLIPATSFTTMNLQTAPNLKSLEDASLVALALDSQRDAFAELVARYQSPICALAFSACGDISQSEDLAQETFIIAWRKMKDLDDPAKFKAWTYGIARNLINNAYRRRVRNPLAAAEPLSESLATSAPASDPSERAITREEQQILWRELSQIPENYREPLVLFYREDQSIERVAEAFDLSEDAVRQRLSRGRKLLQQRMLALVEGTLARSRPGDAFTLSVMTTLPALTATAASSTIGTTALKTNAVAKAAATVGVFAVLKVALIKLLPAAFGAWLMLALPESRRERKFVIKSFGFLWLAAILFALLVIGITQFGPRGYWDAHPRTLALVVLGMAIGFILFVGPYSFWMSRTNRRIQKEEAEKSTNPRAVSMSQPYEYRSRWTLLGLPLLHIRWNCEEGGKNLPAKGWIAIGNTAYGVLFASGAFAVGLVSMGALAVGGVALGGFGIGLFAFGGMSLGVAAMGGLSLGYLAFGGGAVAWLAAFGGAAIARHYAMGGSVIALHANDHAAWDFMQTCAFFRFQGTIFYALVVNSFITPGLLALLVKRLRHRKSVARQVA
jgi:RNA polymerase sigma factor (sigma-70 family)